MVADADRFQTLLPWYANGTLDEEERRRAEGHLPLCVECRELLAHARGFPDAFALPDDHVQAQLLVEFCDDRAALDHDVRRRVEAHLRGCPACRGALDALESLSRSGEAAAGQAATLPAGRPTGFPARLKAAWGTAWSALAGSVLQPVPALAYLTAVLVLVPLAYHLGGRPRPPAAAVPEETPAPAARVLASPISLPGETPFRAETEEGPRPVAMPAGPGGPILMELETDFDAEDLQDPGASFRLVLLQGGTPLLDETMVASDFDRRGVLHLQLDPSRLSTDADYTWVIGLSKPGDPRDGEVLYRRSFRVAPPQ